MIDRCSKDTVAAPGDCLVMESCAWSGCRLNDRSGGLLRDGELGFV
jgi:hypothetical protein